MRIIDTHTHLSTAAFDADRAAVFERASAAGIERFVLIGAAEGLASNHAALAVAKAYANTLVTIGLHPHDAKLFSPETLAELQTLAQSPSVKAWGEIGLDYHYMHSEREIQTQAFVEQLLAAHALNLPIVIHTREAEHDTFDILEKHRGQIADLVFHCFTGDLQMAKRARDLDAYLGLGGVTTFKTAGPIREAIRDYPLERLLLETDCPYLAPIPHRGKRNEPAFLPLVAQCIAEVRDLNVEAIADATTANAERFFRLTPNA